MKTAVVTGASGGIGLETARALLADGWQVVCLSRHACPLEGVRSISCDITDRAQVQAAFAAVDRVDLLVNNAGFGISGAVECTGEAEMRRQFDLNFFCMGHGDSGGPAGLARESGAYSQYFLRRSGVFHSIPKLLLCH